MAKIPTLLNLCINFTAKCKPEKETLKSLPEHLQNKIKDKLIRSQMEEVFEGIRKTRWTRAMEKVFDSIRKLGIKISSKETDTLPYSFGKLGWRRATAIQVRNLIFKKRNPTYPLYPLEDLLR
jgi:hypothetical protein